MKRETSTAIYQDQTKQKEGVRKMKKPVGILLALGLVGILALVGVVFAQEMMEKTGEEADATYPAMGRGMGRMRSGPGMMGMGQTSMMGRGRMMGHRSGRPMRGRGRMMGRMGIMAHLADELDLSEEQKGEINDILTAHRKDMIRKNSEREIAEVELQELMRQENPDLGLIEEQIRKIADLGAGMKYSQIKVHLDVKNVLTEEQRKALKEIAKEKRGQMRGRRGQNPEGKRGSARGRRRSRTGPGLGPR
jgi:Spy/CpxP family protein refolding chaperone